MTRRPDLCTETVLPLQDFPTAEGPGHCPGWAPEVQRHGQPVLLAQRLRRPALVEPGAEHGQ